MKVTISIPSIRDEESAFARGAFSISSKISPGSILEPTKRGARATFSIFDPERGDEVELDGSLDSMVKIFEEGLEILKELQNTNQEESVTWLDNQVRCSFCNGFFDKRSQIKNHLDGLGNVCLSNELRLVPIPVLGTVYVVRQTEFGQLEKKVASSKLEVGDSFCLESDLDHIWFVVEVPRFHFVEKSSSDMYAATVKKSPIPPIERIIWR